MSSRPRAVIHLRIDTSAEALRRMDANAPREQGDPVIRWFLRIWGGLMLALIGSLVIGAAIILMGGLSG